MVIGPLSSSASGAIERGQQSALGAAQSIASGNGNDVGDFVTLSMAKNQVSIGAALARVDQQMQRTVVDLIA
jgi:uncharacterized protein (UPF0218 family)